MQESFLPGFTGGYSCQTAERSSIPPKDPTPMVLTQKYCDKLYPILSHALDPFRNLPNTSAIQSLRVTLARSLALSRAVGTLIHVALSHLT